MDAKSLVMDWNVESDDRVWKCRKSIREKRTAIAMAAAVITTVTVATALYVRNGTNVTEVKTRKARGGFGKVESLQ